MAVDERRPVLEACWPGMVEIWAAGRGLPHTRDGVVVTVEAAPPSTGRALTLRFTRARDLLVVFMTDGRLLRADQLAGAAAVANAWNIEQLVPMLSVWDVHSETPRLAGVCVLPLATALSRPDFDRVADGFAERGGQMFDRCGRVLGL